MSGKTYLFGIDGGGTHSRLLVVEATPLLDSVAAGLDPVFVPVASLRGEGVNVNALGELRVEGNLREFFASLGSATGIGPEDFVAGTLGAAGAGRPEQREAVHRALLQGTALRCPVSVVTDHEIALVGGLRSRGGFLLLSGTGSIAFARSEDGRSFRAGGLGHWLGDEGSAFDVSFQALSRLLRSQEGRDLPCSFGEALLRGFGLRSPEDAVAFVYSRFDKARIAAAARLIAEFRDRGDPLASDIYERAATELVSLLRSVRDRAGDSVADRRVLLWGGMLERDGWLRSRVAELIAAGGLGLEPRSRLGAATEGACLLAVDLVRRP